MPANDTALQVALHDASELSDGQIKFEVTNAAGLGQALGLSFSRSTNPIYVFDVNPADGPPFKAVAYTLVGAGTSRVATRAEAFAKALATEEGALFDATPFLLIFDYEGEQLLAVSGATLFDAFAREAATRSIPYSASASFSLTPSFKNGSVSMYANVTDPEVWASSLSGGALTPDVLMALLLKMRGETERLSPARPEIVAAIQSRLASSPGGNVSAMGASEGLAAVPLGNLPLEVSNELEVRVDPRVWRMILNAIRSARAVMLVGPPGTGKTALLKMAIRAIQAGTLTPAPLWATPDESWTARELVGGETVVGGEIVFRPGWVLRAISEDRWLILDEANRADMDRIFGGLLTWLSGGSVSLGTETSSQQARTIELGWTTGPNRVEGLTYPPEDTPAPGRVRYLAGEDWRLLGTFNALDAQRVFRFGAALGRRFVRVPIPAPEPEIFAAILADRSAEISAEVIAAIHSLYCAHFADEPTRLGPALFLAMIRYVQVALEAKEGEGPILQEIIAEAYLVHIGSWVGNLEPRDLERLRSDVLIGGAFGEEDWDWIVQSAKSLV